MFVPEQLATQFVPFKYGYEPLHEATQELPFQYGVSFGQASQTLFAPTVGISLGHSATQVVPFQYGVSLGQDSQVVPFQTGFVLSASAQLIQDSRPIKIGVGAVHCITTDVQLELSEHPQATLPII